MTEPGRGVRELKSHSPCHIESTIYRAVRNWYIPLQQDPRKVCRNRCGVVDQQNDRPVYRGSIAAVSAVRAHHLSGARATDLMHRMGGRNGIYTRSPLQRHRRDAQTAATTASFLTVAWRPSERSILGWNRSSVRGVLRTSAS